MPESLTTEDVEQLREAVDAMAASLREVREVNGYPVYPQAFRDFTRYVSRSPWQRTDYTADMKKNLRDRIESLTLGEVRSFLTMMIRIDRFSPGGLLMIVKDGKAEEVLARAAELVDG